MRDPTEWIFVLTQNFLGYIPIIIPLVAGLYFARKPWFEKSLEGAAIWKRSLRFLFITSYPSVPQLTTDLNVQPPLRPQTSSVAPSHSSSTLSPLTRIALRIDALLGSIPGARLVACFVGLQFCYLLWGVLQEKVMTTPYGFTQSAAASSRGAAGAFFSDSQFLVFMNRWSALVLAGALLWLTRSDRARPPAERISSFFSPAHSPTVSLAASSRVLAADPPFALYLYSSIANIVSSWMQYEALKYVSFPTQVIAKSAKLISTMLLRRCVARRRFSTFDWCTALFISAGVCLFFVGLEVGPGTGAGSGSSSARRLVKHRPLKAQGPPAARLGGAQAKGLDSNATTLAAVVEWDSAAAAGLVSAVAILVSYLVADSFTSNWQERLFKEYHMSCLHMMFGVNVFSTLLTCVSLGASGGFASALAFAAQHPAFVFDALCVSLSSAVGQLVIFYTISRFGAATFALVMTVRQLLAILLSCALFGHPLGGAAIAGLVLVFAATFARAFHKRLAALLARLRRPASQALGSLPV